MQQGIRGGSGSNQQRQLVPGLAVLCPFLVGVLAAQCSSRRRRSACPSSPAPGAVIQQKALELVTKVWMWAGKYSPVS